MTLALVAVAVLTGAVLQSATGFGFALVTAPVVFAAYSPGTALTLLALLAPLLSVLVLLGERRDVQVRWREVVQLMLWALPGLAVGILILRAVDKPVLQVAVGAAVVTVVALELRGGTRRDPEAAPWPAAPAGAMTGVLSTTVGTSGPPLLLYLLRTGADQHQIRDSLATMFLMLTPPVLVALAVGGRLSLGDVEPAALAGLLVLVAAGRPLGRALFLRLDADRFRRIGLTLALLAGLGSVVAGVAG